MMVSARNEAVRVGDRWRNLFVLERGELQVTVETARYAAYGAYEWTSGSRTPAPVTRA